MKNAKFIFILAIIFSLVSCAELILDEEQEDVSLLCFSNLKAKKGLPAEFQDVPQEIRDVLAGINETRIGQGLLNRVAEALRRYHIKPTFVYRLDLRREFRYQGEGRVEYNFVDMSTDEVLQLIFHELIHMAQEPGELSYRLENEIEAYLGQYFYCAMTNKEFKALRGMNNNNFEEKIKNLANHFDIYTGKATNEEFFQNAFLIALAEIGLYPLYMGWEMGPPPYVVNVLSGLM